MKHRGSMRLMGGCSHCRLCSYMWRLDLICCTCCGPAPSLFKETYVGEAAATNTGDDYCISTLVLWISTSGHVSDRAPFGFRAAQRTHSTQRPLGPQGGHVSDRGAVSTSGRPADANRLSLSTEGNGLEAAAKPLQGITAMIRYHHGFGYLCIVFL